MQNLDEPFFLFIYDNENDPVTITTWELIHQHNNNHKIIPIPGANLQVKQHLRYNYNGLNIQRLPCVIQGQINKSNHIYYPEHIVDELLPLLSK